MPIPQFAKQRSTPTHVNKKNDGNNIRKSRTGNTWCKVHTSQHKYIIYGPIINILKVAAIAVKDYANANEHTHSTWYQCHIHMSRTRNRISLKSCQSWTPFNDNEYVLVPLGKEYELIPSIQTCACPRIHYVLSLFACFIYFCPSSQSW